MIILYFLETIILFLPIFFLILCIIAFVETFFNSNRFDEQYKRKLEKEWKFNSYKMEEK